MAADSTGATTGGAGGVARRAVVGLGGDEDGGDEEAVDVVVRRAKRGPVLLAEPPKVHQSDQEAHRVKLCVVVNAHKVIVDWHRRLGNTVEYRQALGPQVGVVAAELMEHRRDLQQHRGVVWDRELSGAWLRVNGLHESGRHEWSPRGVTARCPRGRETVAGYF